jgi:hypothetical protein
MNTLCEIRVHLLGHDRLDAAELRRAGDVGVELEGFAQQRAVFERDLRRGLGVRGWVRGCGGGRGGDGVRVK